MEGKTIKQRRIKGVIAKSMQYSCRSCDWYNTMHKNAPCHECFCYSKFQNIGLTLNRKTTAIHK